MKVAGKQMTAQQRFDEHYITSSEIAREMEVSRVSVLRARERGDLPDPVTVGDSVVTIWEREVIRPALNAWKVRLHEARNPTPKK